MNTNNKKCSFCSCMLCQLDKKINKQNILSNKMVFFFNVLFFLFLSFLEKSLCDNKATKKLGERSEIDKLRTDEYLNVECY